MKKLLSLPKLLILSLISAYQKTFSPDHGILKGRFPHGYCRHYPSCSEYTKRAIIKYGLTQGLWKAGKRILRCNPWVEPSVDLVI